MTSRWGLLCDVAMVQSRFQFWDQLAQFFHPGVNFKGLFVEVKRRREFATLDMYMSQTGGRGKMQGIPL